MLAIVKALVTFGPDVIKLLGELIKLLQQNNATKDVRKAERIMYVVAWKRAHNITGRPPVPPRPEE